MLVPKFMIMYGNGVSVGNNKQTLMFSNAFVCGVLSRKRGGGGGERRGRERERKRERGEGGEGWREVFQSKRSTKETMLTPKLFQIIYCVTLHTVRPLCKRNFKRFLALYYDSNQMPPHTRITCKQSASFGLQTAW